jgi:hypothetical protein
MDTHTRIGMDTHMRIGTDTHTRIGMDTHMRIGTDTHTRNGKVKSECLLCTGSGRRRLEEGSDPTVEKAQATWPHHKPEAAFIAHRLLLDNIGVSLGCGSRHP